MAWGDPGKTESRFLTDQSPQVANYGAAQANMSTSRLQTAGYVRALRLRIAPTTFTGVPGTGSVAAQPAAQLGAYRMFARVQLTTQVTSDILNVRGEHLYFMHYIQAGARLLWRNFMHQYSLSSPPNAANGGANMANYATSVSYSGTTLTIAQLLRIPISGFIRARSMLSLPGANNTVQRVQVERDMELGIISVQSAQFAMQPRITLNPLYSTGVNAPALVTGNGTVTAGALSSDLDAEIYDVPEKIEDRPPAQMRGTVFSRRTAEDDALAGGGGRHTFLPSGMLVRAVYAFYDVNDNLVDVSTTPNATIDLVWGTTVNKYHETVQENLARCAERYDNPAPQGILVHDFLADDGGGITQAPLTAILANVRVVFAGLPAAAVTLRVLEERLIPVKAAAA